MFDGKTLEGWHAVGDGQWGVENGVIVGRSSGPVRRYGHLVSDETFADFTVRFKFKSLKGNSGFYIRTVMKGRDEAHGLQVGIDPRKDTGGVYESYGRGWLAKVPAEEIAKYYKLDQWNEMTVAAHAGHVVVRVNGVKAVELKNDPGRPKGHFMFQMHVGDEMLVMFKDVEILHEK